MPSLNEGVDETTVAELLRQLDPNPGRPGLTETPKRVARAWEFWTQGYHQNAQEILKEFEDGAEKYDELVFLGGTPVFSHCEHHMTPFFGVAHIGYIPRGKIVGLSKLARLAEVFARRLQVQERLTRQICDALTEHLQPQAVGVVLRCRHLCMESRGVQKVGAVTYTSALTGAFKKEPETRDEFMKFVSMADARVPHL